jgi:tetratricopeptide (TPR) repeat protein
MFRYWKARNHLRDAVKSLHCDSGDGRAEMLNKARDSARKAVALVTMAQDQTGRELHADAISLASECDFELGEIDLAIGGLLGSAAVYLKLADGHSSSELSAIASTLSQIYSHLGDSVRAADLATAAYIHAPDGDRDLLLMGRVITTLIAAGRRDEATSGVCHQVMRPFYVL